jgi:hypothetical protein
LSPAQFAVSTIGVDNSDIILNFEPIINQFQLSGKFYLIHWQATPKGHREFGIYSSVNDGYTSILKLPKFAYGAIQFLQLDDATANNLPSAVIYFKGWIPIRLSAIPDLLLL